MRTITRVAVLVVMISAVNVHQAHASWLAFYEYLEALSGPGPFHGVGVDASVWCDDQSCSWKDFWRPRLPDADTERTIEIAPHVAWLTADDAGDLTYPEGPPDVHLFMYGATVTLWLPGGKPGELRADRSRPKRLQVGLMARASGLHFTGSGVTADDALLRVGPVVNVPLGSERVRLFASPQLQFGLGAFNREDFGAAPGRRLEEPVRLHVQIGVTF
jgi:hypothetical protein